MSVRSLRRNQTSDLSVSQLSLSELQQEFRRRVDALQAKRAELVEQLAELDQQLRSVQAMGAVGPDAGDGVAPRRKRPSNPVPLKELLAQLIAASGPMTTRQAAESALASGYSTTSKSFANNVNVALNSDERFHRVDGKWALLNGAAECTVGETETESRQDAPIGA